MFLFIIAKLPVFNHSHPCTCSLVTLNLLLCLLLAGGKGIKQPLCIITAHRRLLLLLLLLILVLVLLLLIILLILVIFVLLLILILILLLILVLLVLLLLLLLLLLLQLILGIGEVVFGLYVPRIELQ